MIDIFNQKNYMCFTCDLDWAPEIAIKMLLDRFIENEIRPTVFVTHRSQIIEEYKDKIDLGIHPNFIQPSSHGDTIDEIISSCMKYVPSTKVFRCHRWFSSNDIYDKLAEYGFEYESNLCTDLDLVNPFRQRSGMMSFPVFFEDGAYIQHGKRLDISEIEDKIDQKGLKVINIHPMHYALNTPYFSYTRSIKDSLSREEWNSMNRESLSKLAFDGVGIRTLIDQIIKQAVAGSEILSLEQAYNRVKD